MHTFLRRYGPAGGGLLRLHSTYRHDLKIYSSDEGRVQTSAAAFTKGLLDLEGNRWGITHLCSLPMADQATLLPGSDPSQSVVQQRFRKQEAGRTQSGATWQLCFVVLDLWRGHQCPVFCCHGISVPENCRLILICYTGAKGHLHSKALHQQVKLLSTLVISASVHLVLPASLMRHVINTLQFQSMAAWNASAGCITKPLTYPPPHLPTLSFIPTHPPTYTFFQPRSSPFSSRVVSSSPLCFCVQPDAHPGVSGEQGCLHAGHLRQGRERGHAQEQGRTLRTGGGSSRAGLSLLTASMRRLACAEFE